MQAIQGFYENGVVRLDKQAPIKRGRIIVFFPEEKTKNEAVMSDDEAMRLFNKFTGSIDRDIDYERERGEYLSEKYGPFD